MARLRLRRSRRWTWNGRDSTGNGTKGNSGEPAATGTNGLHRIAITNALGRHAAESTGGVLTIDGSNTTFSNASHCCAGLAGRSTPITTR